MTAGDIIAAVDALEPNQYDTDAKLRWLSILDGKIRDQVIFTHEPFGHHHRRMHWRDPLSADNYKPMDCPVDEEEGDKCIIKPPYDDPGDELIVKDPYGSDIYCHYLQAMIALENAESSKYNQQITVFNSAYREWTDMYNRTHMPVQARDGNRFRF